MPQRYRFRGICAGAHPTALPSLTLSAGAPTKQRYHSYSITVPGNHEHTRLPLPPLSLAKIYNSHRTGFDQQISAPSHKLLCRCRWFFQEAVHRHFSPTKESGTARVAADQVTSQVAEVAGIHLAARIVSRRVAGVSSAARRRPHLRSPTACHLR